MYIHAQTEEKEAFYRELKKCVQQCPKNDIKVIIGDVNLKLEKKRKICQLYLNIATTIVKSNDNGTQLVHLAAALDMVAACTHFDHKNVHKRIWVSTDGKKINVLIDAHHFCDILYIRNRIKSK